MAGDPVRDGSKVGLALLHGFGGAPASWNRFRSLLPTEWSVWAPELLGHGVPAGSTDSFALEIERLTKGLVSIAGQTAIEDWWLVGYSMGGRLALGMLAEANLRELTGASIVGATLIGANPGLGGDEARSERRASDDRWARLLAEQGTAKFLESWRKLPLFASQSSLPAAALENQRRIALGHDPMQLAHAMRALSLGAMPFYTDALERIRQPVDWVVGSLDLKFLELAEQAVERMACARLVSVPDVGHNVVLEAPGQLARNVRARFGQVEIT